MPWTDAATVLTITGKTVTAENVALASSIIDTYAGTDADVMPEDAVTARDRRILVKATAWQAAWVANQPGYLDHRSAAGSASADGVSVTRRSQAEEDLAPLAIRELKNLSWIGSRVVDLTPGRLVAKGAMIYFLNEENDPYHGWDELP